MEYEASYQLGTVDPEQAAAGAVAAGALMGMILVMLVVGLVFYLVGAYFQMRIAKKLGRTDLWMAWVPVFNVYQQIKMADKPGWWLVIVFIPIVNIAFIVMIVMVWMEIFHKFGKEKWLGVLMLISPVNIILMGWLGLSDSVQPVAMGQAQPAPVPNPGQDQMNQGGNQPGGPFAG